MIPGGIADKFGNGYEALWTLLQAFEVLRGQYDSIRIEPFDEDAAGFEFQITSSSGIEWHQCKRRLSSGTWTIAALKRTGVLSDFARKLTDPTTTCVFVSSDPASDLKSLCQKASLVDNPTSFLSSLNQDDEVALNALRESWSIGSPTDFDWLRRCRIEVVSDYSLLRQLERLCSLILQEPSSAVIDCLLGYLDRRLTRTLTTSGLRAAVEQDLNLHWRWHLDPTIDEAISRATQSYIGSLRTTIAGSRIATPEGDEAVDELIDDEGSKYLFISGQAGCGKSSTISKLVEAATAAGWPVLAFRIDRVLDCTSIKSLGEAVVGFGGNPAGLLGNRNIDLPALLIIDQVDAVSEASGRSFKARDLLFEMLESAEFFPKLKVAIACRSYDLANDFHLSKLAQSDRARKLELGPLDWEQAVAPILEKIGRGKRIYSDGEKAILSLPLNLNLFAEIALSGEAVEGDLSTARLIAQLLRVREREWHSSGLTWTPLAALGAMAEFMSRNQVLSTPESILAAFPGALDRLSSGGLISRSDGKVQFAHESFFDHVFAVQFLAQSDTVLKLLLATEQRLFRRTQVRQVFAQLRDNGVDHRYLSNLSEVMSSDKVRYLVKDAIGAWLATVERPTQGELNLVLRWFEPSNQLFKISQVIITGPHWLGIVTSSGSLSAWLKEEGENETFAFWLLRRQATLNPGPVRALLATWWEKHPDRTVDLVNWFGTLFPEGSIGELEEFYSEVVQACPADFFSGEELPDQAGLGGWSLNDPARGARMLGLWLRRWMEAVPGSIPLADRNTPKDRYWIGEIASKAPAAFLTEIIPILIETVSRDRRAYEAGTIHYSVFETPCREERDGLEGYVTLIRRALVELAMRDPPAAEGLLDLLSANLSLVSLHLQLETIAANGRALAHRLPALLDCPGLFKSGYLGAEWISFAEAARECMPFLAERISLRVEEAAAHHKPEFAYIKKCLERDEPEGEASRSSESRRCLMHELSRTGFVERAVLKTMGRSNLSARGQRRLDELDRKFSGEALPEPLCLKGGWVESPIEAVAASKMSDHQWMSAMRRYSSDGGHIFFKDRVVGGSEQLARVLKAQVPSNPERFVALFERLPLDMNKNYAEAIIQGIGESDASTEIATRAVRVALTWPAKSFDRSISWAIEKKPEAGVIPEALTFLVTSAETGDASDSIVTQQPRESDRDTSVGELLDSDFNLTMNGINGERGAAYEAIADVLWISQSTLATVLPFIERQLDVEPLESVLVCMTRVINSIAKYMPEKGIELFLRLAKRNIRPLNSASARHFLHWGVYNYPERFEPLIDELQRSEVEQQRALGIFMLSGLALSNDEAAKKLIFLWPDSSLARRVSAYRASGNVSSDGVGERAAGWVVPFFSDDDPAVREEASHCGWSKVLNSDTGRAELADFYLQSPTFEEHPDQLIRALEDRVDVFRHLALRAAKRLISLLETWSKAGNLGRHLSVHYLGKMLVNLYRAFETEADCETEILDLFDGYLQQGVYGVREAISGYERH